jgi:uncharacterized protein YjbJ (UPF0337 family)
VGLLPNYVSAQGATIMAGESDKIKGRVKEAAGALTDDDRLRREGKADQTAGEVKEKVSKAVDNVKEAITGKKE